MPLLLLLLLLLLVGVAAAVGVTLLLVPMLVLSWGTEPSCDDTADTTSLERLVHTGLTMPHLRERRVPEQHGPVRIP
jgi:hypothetical protein